MSVGCTVWNTDAKAPAGVDLSSKKLSNAGDCSSIGE